MKSFEFHVGSTAFSLKDSRLYLASGDEVPLRAQSRQVLDLLATRAPETVTKDEFIDAIWNGAVVSDESLAKCIAEIRKAIGDGEKRVIETVPRKGYRFHVAQRTGGVSTARIVALGFLVVALVALAVGSVWLFDRTPTGESRPRVAVLPFRDLSPEPYRGHLSDAVSEGVIVDLAQFPELVVISESSSFRFRADDRSYQEVGSKLDVDYILDGGQQFDGETVQITARLVEADSGASLWSDRFTTDVRSLFDVNQTISNRVGHAVADTVAEVEASVETGRDASPMLDYFRARELTLGGLSRERLGQAQAMNQSIIDRYPDAPWGYIGLAFNLRAEVRFGWNVDPGEDVLALAEAHAKRAVELGPDNYAAYFALGRVKMQQGDVEQAIVLLERATALNPASSHVLVALAQPFLYLGEPERGLEVLDQAALIDPLGGFILHWMTAWLLWQDTQCDAALASLHEMASIPPPAKKLLAVVQTCRGDEGAAEVAITEFLDNTPGWTVAQEAALHASAWRDQSSLDRWLSDLADAGLPAN